MRSPSSLEGGKIVCHTLATLGARHVFGIPGTQNTQFYEALRRSPLQAIVPTDELAAAFMAGAYHRVTGEPGVLTTIPGPGLAYALAGLAEARLDSAAVLYIVNAREPAARIGYGLQAIDQHALLRPVTKALITVGRLADIPAAIAEGWRLARAGEPGPVAVELATDAGTDAAPIEGAPIVDGPVPVASDADLAAAWTRIGAARRPVILAGQGALETAAEVQALAERLGAPVLTTPSARGIVPEALPHVMGLDVLRGTLEAANALLAKSDLVLVLGAKLGHNGSAGFTLDLPPDKLVRIDTSRDALDSVYPASAALLSPVRAFLDRPEATAVTRSAWTGDEMAAHRGAIRTPRPRPEPRIAGGEPQRFFAALRAALPDETRLVTDTGMHQVTTRRHFEVRAPGGLLMPSDFQSMGFGLPAAIAARLADPRRAVVALIGDGGFRMTGFELSTAARAGVVLPVIVFNDGSLNQIRLQQLGEYGRQSATELGPLDLEAFALTVDADYAFVATPVDIAAALGTALTASRSTIIEVPVGDSPQIRKGAARARLKGVARKVTGSRLARLLGRS